MCFLTFPFCQFSWWHSAALALLSTLQTLNTPTSVELDCGFQLHQSNDIYQYTYIYYMVFSIINVDFKPQTQPSSVRDCRQSTEPHSHYNLVLSRGVEGCKTRQAKVFRSPLESAQPDILYRLQTRGHFVNTISFHLPRTFEK